MRWNCCWTRGSSSAVVHDAEGSVRCSQPSLEQWLKVDRDRVRGLLNRWPYEAHASQADLVGTADLAESDLVMGFCG